MKKQNQVLAAPPLKPNNKVVLELWVKAGGRCEFKDCNKYLLEEEDTGDKARIQNIAHIVGRSIDGPRGNYPLDIGLRNGIDNIMLTCTNHHGLIDKKHLVKKYSVELLREYKKQHEDRIKIFTNQTKENSTTIIKLVGEIRGSYASVPEDQMINSVFESTGKFPNYIAGKNHVDIDLMKLGKSDKSYFSSAFTVIDENMRDFIYPSIKSGQTKHVSLFGFARIPLLVYLGVKIGDKIPTSIYQKQRNASENWLWDTMADSVMFRLSKISAPGMTKKIILLLSISGKIDRSKISKSLLKESTIFEIEPVGAVANRMLLGNPATLKNFRKIYQDFFSLCSTEYPRIKKFDLIPATPISISIACGRDLLKEGNPRLRIHDLINNKYKLIAEVN